MDLSSLSQRLRVAMAEQGLTQSALADKAGISQTAVQKLTSGNARSTTRIFELAEALNVSPQWLAHGQGDMRISDVDQLIKKNTNPKSDISSAPFKATVWEGMNEPDGQEFVNIPLIDVEFSAGPGRCELVDDETFSLIFRRYSLRKMGVSAQDARLVRVSGDSMYPTLSDGDIVGINTSEKSIRDGKTYAICHDDMLRIKTLVSRPGEIIIRSLNRELYPDEIIDAPNFHKNVRIIGRVFWSSHTW